MRLIEKNNNEFVIRERTSLKGNSGDITNLNISSELYHEIKDLDSSKILIEKIIYDMHYPLLKNFELDNELKAIGVACLRIKGLIENDEVSHKKGAK